MAMKCLLKCHLRPFPFTLPAAASVEQVFSVKKDLQKSSFL